MEIVTINIGSTSLKWCSYNLSTLEFVSKGADLDTVPSQASVFIHRLVHAGTIQDYIWEWKSSSNKDDYIKWAPLHNQKTIDTIVAIQDKYPNARHYVISDSYFHRTLPEHIRILPIPKEIRDKGAKKYGFHGLAYQSVMDQIPTSIRNVIAVHLGGGCSMACIRDRQCIDTTMTLTPTDGLVMATRSGTLDPTILSLFPQVTSDVLNKESGLIALCGSGDMRHITNALHDPQMELALTIYVYAVVKSIGAMYFTLNGHLDALVFSGGVGYNNRIVLDRILLQVSNILGIKHTETESCDKPKSGTIEMSDESSKVKVLLVDVDESVVMLNAYKENFT